MREGIMSEGYGQEKLTGKKNGVGEKICHRPSASNTSS
jgi:hypothetical protein